MTEKIVGAKYKLVKRHSVYNIGDIIYLVEDDGTDIPFFSLRKEDDRRNNYDSVHCVTMDKVVLFEEPKKQESPTFNKGDKVRCTRYHGGDVRVGDIGISNGDGTFDFPSQTGWSDLDGVHVELVEEADTQEKPRKKKILYPVGTKGRNEYGTFEVIDYTKGGVPKPYRIKYLHSSFNLIEDKFRKTLDEMKTYTYEVDSHPQETAQTPVKSISTDDVDKLIKEAEDRIRKEMRAEASYKTQEITDQLMRAQVLAVKSPVIACYHNKSTPKKAEKKSTMSTIREKIRYATLSKDERILRESGILSENGNITEQGRRVVLDILFEDKDLRAQVVALVKKTLPKDDK